MFVERGIKDFLISAVEFNLQLYLTYALERYHHLLYDLHAPSLLNSTLLPLAVYPPSPAYMSMGFTPVDTNILRLLLEKGADPNAKANCNGVIESNWETFLLLSYLNARRVSRWHPTDGVMHLSFSSSTMRIFM
jgi:hypothetical protein